MPQYRKITLPQSAKKIRDVENEDYDIKVGIWETRTHYFYHIKVADVCWISRRPKNEYLTYTRIPEFDLEMVEDIAKRKTASTRPMTIKMLAWVTNNFRY